MKKASAKRSQVAHSWGILLGMAGIPVLALLSKVFPNLDTVWGVLLVLFGLIIARSVVGYLFPAGSNAKKSHGAAAQTDY
jgi:SNF family Na+-dependent transporter